MTAKIFFFSTLTFLVATLAYYAVRYLVSVVRAFNRPYHIKIDPLDMSALIGFILVLAGIITGMCLGKDTLNEAGVVDNITAFYIGGGIACSSAPVIMAWLRLYRWLGNEPKVKLPRAKVLK